MNFPRFLHSRTLKQRNSQHRTSESNQRPFRLRTEGQNNRGLRRRPEQNTKLDLTKVLLQRKSTPADIIRFSKMHKQDASVSTEEEVAKWLNSRTISLNNKRRKMKIVVALPKAKGKHFTVLPRDLMDLDAEPQPRGWMGPLHLQQAVPKEVDSPVKSDFLKLGLGQYH